jgi:hypothetical protein
MIEDRFGLGDHRMMLGGDRKDSAAQVSSLFRFASIKATILIEQFAKSVHASDRTIAILL